MCKLAVVLLSAIPLLAQSSNWNLSEPIQEQLGPPLSKQTFAVPVGEMVVNYAKNGHVCTAKLTPLGTDAGAETPSAVDEFLLKLIPANARGKQLSALSHANGRLSAKISTYENVRISTSFQDGHQSAVKIAFPENSCEEK